MYWSAARVLPPGFTRCSLYTGGCQGIAAVNEGMKKVAGEYPGVSFLDCGAPYLSGGSEPGGGGRLVEELMPDALHPYMKGVTSSLMHISRPKALHVYLNVNALPVRQATRMLLL